MTRADRPSQTERVLVMLREAGATGCCSSEFYAAHLPHARNRLAVELRDRGFLIERGPCEDDHGTARYFRYRIVFDPERQPKQLALIR